MIKPNQPNQQGVICILFCSSAKQEKIKKISQSFKTISNYKKSILEKFFHASKRSSRPEVFLRKGVLKICNKFTRRSAEV